MGTNGDMESKAPTVYSGTLCVLHTLKKDADYVYGIHYTPYQYYVTILRNFPHRTRFTLVR